MKEMKNQSVLITGGTSGIGLAAARLFLDAGANVAIAGRKTKQGEAALQSLETPNRVYFFPADVRLATDCDRLVKEAKKNRKFKFIYLIYKIFFKINND